LIATAAEMVARDQPNSSWSGTISTPTVERACTQLFESLAARGIPLTLISQYLPAQYAAIRAGQLENEPRELVIDGVEQVLRQYERACRPANPAGHGAVDRGSE